jgi:AraC family transcriptional activator FtrA
MTQPAPTTPERWRQRPAPTPRRYVQPPESTRLAARLVGRLSPERQATDEPPAPGGPPLPTHPQRVAVVVTDSVFTLELGTIVDVLETANVCSGHPLYEVAVVAATPTVRGTGLTITADQPLRWADTADTVLVPGHSVLAEDGPHDLPVDYLNLVRRASQRGARVGALCLGPFVLAAAGVLDHRTVALHWNWADDFAAEYPQSDINADALFVQDGNIYTGGGGAMTMDLMLHLIAEDHGETLAAVVARYLLSPPRRHAGHARQADHSSSWQESPLRETLLWATENATTIVGVDDLARHAHMSVRSLHRHFRAYVGTTPTEWLLRARIRHAQELLETTSWSIERVAHESGFGSESTLRYHFARVVESTPGHYRRTFRLTPSTERLSVV